MRRASIIEEAWNAGGPFTGGNAGGGMGSGSWKANTVVTVQAAWPGVTNGNHVIFPTTDGVGGLQPVRGLPIRWYQKADGSEVEVVVPNIKSVSIDRSIEQDAASCTVGIYNTWMYENGLAPEDEIEIGQHGYFTPTRGEDMSAQARWGHSTNEWNRVLVPNAILRTYQGYGGDGKTLDQAVADGNLVKTGVWLVDTLSVNSQGEMTLECRDMAKLLIDQMIFEPLVPQSKYPLKYWRYEFKNRQIAAAFSLYEPGGGIDPTGLDLSPGDRAFSYSDSSQDRWYGSNANLHGHRGSDSADGMDVTYALSVGNSGPNKPFSTVWWEYDVDDTVNAVYLHPWAGGYTMYVSVLEQDPNTPLEPPTWQGDQKVPYDYSPLIGRQPHVVDTEAHINYVAAYQIPFETSGEYVLPRIYNAVKIRVSFRNLYDSGIGPWRYRAGIREFKPRVTSGAGDIASKSLQGKGEDDETLVPVAPIFYAADYLRDVDDLNRAGYITVSNYGFVDVFGDCREYPPQRADDEEVAALIRAFINAAGSDASEISSVALTPKGDGYWILYSRGIVRSYGAAIYMGEPYDQFNFESGAPNGGINKAATIVSTNSGNGYWVITFAGEIFAYGDAEDYADVATLPSEFIHGACAHPGKPTDPQGLYLLSTHGAVYTYGAAVYCGGYDETFNVSNAGQGEIAIDIDTTYRGDGYWILTSAGRVQPFGAAQDYGELDDPQRHLGSFDRYYQIMSTPESDGYLILDGDGKIEQRGDTYMRYFGAPIPGTQGQLRNDGNYLDFADIIRDLVLWSGFFLKGETPQNEYPAVYGNIEGTGMFSEEALPDEMFDKRPVIEAITELKESVGYLCWVDDEGAFRFESPNWWGPGNFLYDGTHTDEVYEIDERHNMMSYSYSTNDENLRSRIIISSEDPYGGGSSTVYTEFIPNTADDLRGLLKPAMWVNGYFQKKLNQQIMAELIALHVWFSQRVGEVQCAANPCISINDQVRVYERTTSETYLHYVRSVQTTHNLDTGEYTMTLQTNWLGSGDEWLVTPLVPEDSTLGHFILSQETVDYLCGCPSAATAAGGYELDGVQ